MGGGLLLLLALCAVMAFASFLAGALPLSMTLTQPQLRLISSIGVGILVGTSLIVIIPEGVEAIVNPLLSAPTPAAVRRAYALRRDTALSLPDFVRRGPVPEASVAGAGAGAGGASVLDDILLRRAAAAAADAAPGPADGAATGDSDTGADAEDGKVRFHHGVTKPPPKEEKVEEETKGEGSVPVSPPTLPTFFIGFALVTGFVLMFLIDRLPRHAVDKLQSGPTTRHISLDNLASSSGLGRGGDGDGDDDYDGSGGEEEAGSFFLGSLTPTPRQSRGLATTVGLVIHAAADGIAMGASATTSDMKLGLVIFVAIMVHKAPAAFGLTSVLLKHGLSKRAARGHLVVFSLAAPTGAVATFVLIKLLGGGGSSGMEGERGQWWTGMLLLFSAGTFLYVAMQAMQEESSLGGSGGGSGGGGLGHDHHLLGGGLGGGSLGGGYLDAATLAAQRRQSRPQMRDTLATIVGMLLPLLTQFGHHH